MNILFDGNYLFHRNFSIFSTYYKDQDMSDILQDKEKLQVLIRKCVIDLCFTLRKFEDVDKVAFVIDSSSWRYSIYDNYKYSLTKVKETFYKYFLIALNEFESLLRKKGIIVSRVMGAEGDDLLYVWSLYFGSVKYENLVIITGDSDIRQIMNENVSLFNNNSKNLKLYCIPENENYWNKYLDTDEIEVIPVKPFEVLLYKVIMGDTSDNIEKLKRGFGPKAFEKFIEEISPYEEPENIDLSEMSEWIASRFSKFVKIDKKEILEQVIFNLKMTWLNLSVYNEIDYKTENGKSLLDNMLDDVNNQKDKYSYNKEYSLENFYGLVIK